MKHPEWKRAQFLKAVRLRKRLTTKELCRRMKVPPSTADYWIKCDRGRR